MRYCFIALILILIQTLPAQTTRVRFSDLPFSFGLGLNAGITKLHTGIPVNARIGPVAGLTFNFAYPISSHFEMFADAVLPEIGTYKLNERENPDFKLRFGRAGGRYGLSWDLGSQKKWKLGPFVHFMGVDYINNEFKLSGSEEFCNPDDPEACIDMDNVYSLGLDLGPGVRLGYVHKKWMFGCIASMSVLNLQDDPTTTIRQSNLEFFATTYFIGNTTEASKPTKKYNW